MSYVAVLYPPVPWPGIFADIFAGNTRKYHRENLCLFKISNFHANSCGHFFIPVYVSVKQRPWNQGVSKRAPDYQLLHQRQAKKILTYDVGQVTVTHALHCRSKKIQGRIVTTSTSTADTYSLQRVSTKIQRKTHTQTQ